LGEDDHTRKTMVCVLPPQTSDHTWMRHCLGLLVPGVVGLFCAVAHFVVLGYLASLALSCAAGTTTTGAAGTTTTGAAGTTPKGHAVSHSPRAFMNAA